MMVKLKTKEFYSVIGEKIASIRKEAGLSQEQLAQKVDLTQPVLASYEVGRRRIPIPALIKIANALNTFVEDLLPIDDKNKKRGPKPKIEREMENIKMFPTDQQDIILNLIETYKKANQK